MKKIKQKHNFIEINGRRYDASSGAALNPAATATAVSPAVSVPVRVMKPAAVSTGTSRPSRQPAKNLRGHAPQPARTLMRQAVRKPAPVDTKRSLRVVGRVDLPAADVTVIVKPSASRLDAARLHHAEHVKRSHLISRFDRRQLMAGPAFVATETVAVTNSPSAPQAALPTSHHKRPQTTADVLEMALQNATSHLQPPVKPERHRRVWRRRHAAAH